MLRCDSCGTSTATSVEELLRYTSEGWPRCCGRVMVLFTESKRPGQAGGG